MKLNKIARNLNCPYLKVKLNKQTKLRGYTDSGATVSLISDAVLSEKQLKSLRPYNRDVNDANGNTIDILGEVKVKFKVDSSSIYEKFLVFKKNKAIVHDLLIGMYILKFSEKSLVERIIRFSHAKTPQNKKKAYSMILLL